MEQQSGSAERRLRCRIGLHRWVRVKYTDADLENPGAAAAAWRTSFRYCGIARSGGSAVFAVVALAILGIGIALALTTQSLLSGLIIMGGVAAVGRVAFVGGLTRIATFLSTGTWRPR